MYVVSRAFRSLLGLGAAASRQHIQKWLTASCSALPVPSRGDASYTPSVVASPASSSSLIVRMPSSHHFSIVVIVASLIDLRYFHLSCSYGTFPHPILHSQAERRCYTYIIRRHVSRPSVCVPTISIISFHMLPFLYELLLVHSRDSWSSIYLIALHSMCCARIVQSQAWLCHQQAFSHPAFAR